MLSRYLFYLLFLSTGRGKAAVARSGKQLSPHDAGSPHAHSTQPKGMSVLSSDVWPTSYSQTSIHTTSTHVPSSLSFILAVLPPCQLTSDHGYSPFSLSDSFLSCQNYVAFYECLSLLCSVIRRIIQIRYEAPNLIQFDHAKLYKSYKFYANFKIFRLIDKQQKCNGL